MPKYKNMSTAKLVSLAHRQKKLSPKIKAHLKWRGKKAVCEHDSNIWKKVMKK